MPVLEAVSLLGRYLRQQKTLGYSDIILTKPLTKRAIQSPTPVLRIAPEPAVATAATVSAPAPVLPPAAKASVVWQPNTNKTYEEKRADLVKLFYEFRECKSCSLSANRAKFVFGAGNAGAPLFIIGDAPDDEDDKQGIPFSGPAGDILNRMLSDCGLDKKTDTFITNMLKCRPPANRSPQENEVLACNTLLARQIAVINPEIILLLGKTAAQGLLNVTDTLANLRSTIFDYQHIPVFVTYHPKAALRNQLFAQQAHEDFLKVKKFLDEARKNGSRE
jgi:DNA polymerase